MGEFDSFSREVLSGWCDRVLRNFARSPKSRGPSSRRKSHDIAGSGAMNPVATDAGNIQMMVLRSIPASSGTQRRVA